MEINTRHSPGIFRDGSFAKHHVQRNDLQPALRREVLLESGPLQELIRLRGLQLPLGWPGESELQRHSL